MATLVDVLGVGLGLPDPLPGDPAPIQECALVVLKCAKCGNEEGRWRPVRMATEMGTLVLLMGLACRKCDGPVEVVVRGYGRRVPEGPVAER